MNVLSSARVRYWILNYCLIESAASSSPLKRRPRRKSPCRQPSQRKSARTSTKACKERTGSAQNQNPKPDRIEPEPDSKLIRLILDLKAEIGVLRKAMRIHGITIESAPTKNKEQSSIAKQNGKFAGIAKKKRTMSRRPSQQRSLVNPTDAPSDSNVEPQEQAYSVVMVKQKSKTICPRSMNAMQGYTRYDHKDASCIDMQP